MANTAAANPVGGPLSSVVAARSTKALPPTSLITRRPTPGQPRAKVEKSRRTESHGEGTPSSPREKPPKEVQPYPLESLLAEGNDAALYSNDCRVGAVVGPELRQDVLDAAFDRVLGYR
jgi:hypothetical protein